MEPENRAVFEKMGLDAVRLDLLRGFTIPKGPMRFDALDWVSEQERKQKGRENRRYWVVVFLSAVAAVAGSIAAWPVLKGAAF